jgi:site-specific recombinase XerD
MQQDDIHTIPLRELQERHAGHARTLNKSEKTIGWYALALTDFCRFLEESCAMAPPATLGSFTLQAVRDYILYLRARPAFAHHPFRRTHTTQRPLSDHSVNCYVRALRAFASWLYDQEYTEANLLGRLKAPKVTKRTVEILTDDEISRILDTLASRTATNARNRAIFLTLLDTGARASELLTLTLPRMHLDEGYLLVLGKGKKERPVKIGQTAAQAIRLYVSRYRPMPANASIAEVFLTEGYRVSHPASTSAREVTGSDVVDGIEEQLLFSEPGWPLSYDALRNLFQRLGKRSGVLRLHAHLLRHTYSCRYLLAHRDPLALKTMLGHTTLDMTNHYVAAVEGMQVIRSDRVSVVDAMELNVRRPKRSKPRRRQE